MGRGPPDGDHRPDLGPQWCCCDGAGGAGSNWRHAGAGASSPPAGRAGGVRSGSWTTGSASTRPAPGRVRAVRSGPGGRRAATDVASAPGRQWKSSGFAGRPGEDPGRDHPRDRPTPIRVLVADDHPVVRSGYRHARLSRTWRWSARRRTARRRCCGWRRCGRTSSDGPADAAAGRRERHRTHRRGVPGLPGAGPDHLRHRRRHRPGDRGRGHGLPAQGHPAPAAGRRGAGGVPGGDGAGPAGGRPAGLPDAGPGGRQLPPGGRCWRWPGDCHVEIGLVGVGSWSRPTCCGPSNRGETDPGGDRGRNGDPAGPERTDGPGPGVTLSSALFTHSHRPRRRGDCG